MSDNCNARLEKLIELLNDMPDIKVVDACGGHKSPASGLELPFDNFSVVVAIEPNSCGFGCLGIITLAAQRLDKISILGFIDGEQPNDLVFIIRGYPGSSPDDMCRGINAIAHSLLRPDPQFCQDCQGE